MDPKLLTQLLKEISGIRKILFVILLALVIGTCFGCGHPERYGCNINADGTFTCLDGSSGILPDGPQGPQGPAGEAGESCTVTDSASGAIIICPDGSEVEIFDGEDGSDGKKVIIICHKRKHGPRICTRRD